jgi:hypothetical protein
MVGISRLKVQEISSFSEHEDQQGQLQVLGEALDGACHLLNFQTAWQSLTPWACFMFLSSRSVSRADGSWPLDSILAHKGGMIFAPDSKSA